MDWRRPGLYGRCGGDPMPLDIAGDLDLSPPVRVDSRRRATPLSLPILSPGKPSLDSWRYMGVAVGSMDTAERIGNTRSIEPGLRVEIGSLEPCEGDGDDGRSVRPVNIDTDVSLGLKALPMLRSPGV